MSESEIKVARALAELHPGNLAEVLQVAAKLVEAEVSPPSLTKASAATFISKAKKELGV